MEILEETSANWLVQHENGTTETVGKSQTNRALIEHDLWGLLKDGNEVLVLDAGDQPTVTVIPDDEAKSFTLQVEEYDSIHLGPHQKSRLVDALMAGKEENDKEKQTRAVLDLFDSIRDNQVRADVISALSETSPFTEYIEDTADGWLIHGHLLLTWEGEFYHPDTTAYEVSGSAVNKGSAEPAYDVDLDQPDSQDRSVELGGEDYRLTNAEMGFIAKALWAIERAPKEV